MSTLFIALAGGVCVAAIVGAVAMIFRDSAGSAVEDRLDVIAGKGSSSMSELSKKEQSILTRPLDEVPNVIEEVFGKILNVRRLLDQAHISMEPASFLGISIGFGAAGVLIAMVFGLHWVVSVVISLVLMWLPIFWAKWKRKRRMQLFTKQLPEALDLTARALRAGHSLGSGFQLVAAEIPEPLGVEFGRVYEEQNLGIPLEDALDNLCDRVPSLDLRFFATAVILQRTTGGDLAEILEKIGHLIRERFKIYGMIQALTGEGRLSGAVLLAMPPILMIVMFVLNHDYIMLLFTDDLGKKMLAVACLMQLMGALVIKKIVNIKV